jgi:hypothetical protein
MTKPQCPLGEISGNIQKRRELTPYEQGQIIGAAKCSIKPSAISTKLSLSRCTVRTTLSREPLAKTVRRSLDWVDHKPILNVTNDYYYELYVNFQNIPICSLCIYKA